MCLNVKRFVLCAVLSFISLNLFSQELKVKEFYKDDSAIDAIKFQVKDANGDPTALIKVGLTVGDAIFEGDILKSEYKDGEYWIYMVDGANWLSINTKRYLPLRYEFEPVAANCTYIMQIEKPMVAYDGPTGTVVISGNVKNADVYIDGEKMSSIVPYEYVGPEGEHIVELKAAGYNTERSKINVELNKKLNHYVTMHNEGTFSLNGISYEMVRVEGGTFFMGSSSDNNKKNTFSYEKPVHEVTLRSFSIGKTEVTQALWVEVMGSNPSIHVGENLPVENVTWKDCMEFITKLNERTGLHFRLPTEAEWEYAARGRGMSDADGYAGNGSLSKVAHIGSFTIGVGLKQANQLGLHDMSGNVAEWCSDWLGKYTAAKVVNPTGADMGVRKVVRGGACNNEEWFLRTAYRGSEKPGEASPYIGLRLAQDI